MGSGEKYMLSVDPPPQLPSISNAIVPAPIRSPSPGRELREREHVEQAQIPQALRPAPQAPKKQNTINGQISATVQRAAPPPPASVVHAQAQVPSASRPAPSAPGSAQGSPSAPSVGGPGVTAPLQPKRAPRSRSPHGKPQPGQVLAGGGSPSTPGTSGSAPPGATGATPRRREKPGDKEKEANIIRRLQSICTDADPTKLYKGFTKIGQGFVFTLSL